MYTLLKPEAFWYLESDINNPEFQFSLEWVDQELIQFYLDNNIIDGNN